MEFRLPHRRRGRRQLVDAVVAELAVPPEVSHQAAARRVCEVIRDRLGGPLEVCFTPMGEAGLSGLTLALADGRYLVVCADSPRWYHRLQILLHELAHIALDHERTPCARSGFADPREREAEEFADALLAALTERRPRRGDEVGW
ncbi:ImmA/IrrE family metallo-endopeptidase [Kutzneria sp. NPDC051319]|uniref:ImmA/IrrE family metallo-endopeptidase n=1 Tax=Kutzneria sp. NPDC051319 TaxID=3155047 RepID=UPI0034140301